MTRGQMTEDGPCVCPPIPSSDLSVVPQIASFSSFEARKATFLLALIWMASPVAGLRPMRAARLRTCRMPRPPMRIRSPFFRCLTIWPTRPPRMASACFFDSSLSSATLAARCFNVTVVAGLARH